MPDGDPALLNRLAWSRRWLDRAASMDYANKARAAAKAGSGRRSRIEQGRALRTLAWHARWQGAFDTSMSHCLSAETFLPETEHPEARAIIYSILGGVHFARNRFDLANCAVDRGFWLLRDRQDGEAADAMGALLLTRATIQRFTGERARAGITLGRAQELTSDESSPCVEYCTSSWLLADGDAEAARVHATNAVEIAIASRNMVMLPYAHTLLGSCDLALGRLNEAEQSLATAMTLAIQVKDDRVRCFVHRNLAEVDIARRNLDRAQEHLEKSARIAKTQGNAFERKRIALALADLFERQDKLKKALAQHKLAWRLQNETRIH